MPPWENVYLVKDVQELNKYGRMLAYVWLDRPLNDSDSEVRAKMFNARMLLGGYAQVMTVPPNVKYVDLFVKLQREAREAGKGRWVATIAPVPGSGNSASEAMYIGNSSSKKIHRPDCQWAKKIAPGNKVDFKSRDEAMGQGYTPCEVCEP